MSWQIHSEIDTGLHCGYGIAKSLKEALGIIFYIAQERVDSYSESDNNDERWKLSTMQEAEGGDDYYVILYHDDVEEEKFWILRVMDD